MSGLLETQDEVLVEDLRQLLSQRHRPVRSIWPDIPSGDEDDPFHTGAVYSRRAAAHASDLESEWFKFELSIKTESRFFNKQAETMLASIFKELAQYRTVVGASVIVAAGP